MKIISWNVNGIRAVYKKGFLDWFKKADADIVCLQETKADNEQFPKELKEIDGYNFYCSSAQKKGYSGTAVWAKTKPQLFSSSIENEKFDIEGRIVKAEFKKFVLFNIYFPNGGASEERLKYKLDFYDYFIDYISKIKNKDVIVCGDYNTAHSEIDLSRPKENEKNSGFMPIERERLDTLEKAGFADTFRHFNKEGGNYTWWDYKTGARARNVGWRLDYFFINKESLKFLTKAEICSDILGSDHCPISIEIY
ncbi:MAG: exodeoxyribonuclease III [Elusimicrobiota bacterium]|jgi:exodeoxyribonuclease-3|nr:exodeoxyribonuclease III [Elusimicrobiota bacterium]